MSFIDGTTIPVIYDGYLTYLPIRIPTKDEVHNCRILHFRSGYPWGYFLLNRNFSCMESLMGHIDVESFVDDVTKVCPIGSNFISTLSIAIIM